MFHKRGKIKGMTHKPEQFTENEGKHQHHVSPRSKLVCHMYGLNTVLQSEKQYTLHQIFFFSLPWQSGKYRCLSAVLTSQILTAI